MKMKLFLVTVACFAITFSIYSFDTGNQEEGTTVKSDHYLQGKEVYVKLNYDSLWDQASDIYSDEGQKLVNSCIDKYGGVEHLNKINTLKLIYQSESALLNNTQEITKYFQKDKKHKTIITENGNLVKERIFNNYKAWDKTPESTQEIILQEYKKEYFEYILQLMPLGINDESFSGIRYGKRDDDNLEYVYLKKDDTLMTILGINHEDFLIKKIEGVVIQDDRRYVFIYLFSDFKDFQGYTFPSKRKYVSMGLEVSDAELVSVEINPILQENEFLAE